MESERPPRDPIEVRKGRGQWSHWAGTPSSLATLAERALELVRQGGSDATLRVTATAPAFDAEFSTPDQIRSGLKPADLKEISELSLAIDQLSADEVPRRIAVTLVRPKTWQASRNSESIPAVRLSVTGQHRDWVDLATLRMSQAIGVGARPTTKVRVALAGAGLILFVLTLVGESWEDEKEALSADEVASLIFAIGAGITLLLALFLEAVTPQLELLPEGGSTRWQRLTRHLDVSGRWLLDAVLKGAIGAGVAILITRLF